jgi:hypothetical protein
MQRNADAYGWHEKLNMQLQWENSFELVQNSGIENVLYGYTSMIQHLQQACDKNDYPRIGRSSYFYGLEGQKICPCVHY